MLAVQYDMAYLSGSVAEYVVVRLFWRWFWRKFCQWYLSAAEVKATSLHTWYPLCTARGDCQRV